MPDEATWINLYNPTLNSWHRVSDDPVVVQEFQDRGWLTPEESAAKAEAEATELRGRDLDKALDDAGLSKAGTVKEKQARLAEHAAEHAVVAPEEADQSIPGHPTTEENEDQ